ncbi:16S rRNA (cytosine(967)-C(5))-methyltransferase RsmB [uncultured Dubosiella sp.]|uniref:16S rRNA (cytosine(967)-C(5))-methyltransferase RsmB n=2 Tax=uncultured Dubosiella sp. TaxID=1937011 RepID=UPI00273222B2|nr:16S rRNA (cytosine(967)-C(5))-methyltransferase RsmB [uncultured Dubosiella sp.]
MVRNWILEALCAVVADGAYSNLYLKKHLREVDEKDRALATTIFYGTLRNYTYCQRMWSQYSNGNKVHKKIRVLLTMSVYQLLFLEKVPAYAVISEAVSLAKTIRPQAAGFVNAILRKVDRERKIEFRDDVDEIATTYSIAPWLVKMWIAQYGADRALAFAKASLDTQSLSVRRNVMKDKPEVDRLQELRDPIYQYTGNTLEADPLYREGVVSPQDLGAYEIVRVLDPKPEETILDVCAAPGTKTMAIAETMHDQGHVVALDLHPHRVALIQNDIRRLHLKNVEARCQDATDLSGLGLYGRVLCDVPCTGYGTLSRKPDIKLHLDPATMDTLIPVQAAILEQAGAHVKPGGVLVYSTCTLNQKENEKQVAKFLKSHPAFSLDMEKTIEPSKTTNGFYVAKLKKSADDVL